MEMRMSLAQYEVDVRMTAFAKPSRPDLGRIQTNRVGRYLGLTGGHNIFERPIKSVRPSCDCRICANFPEHGAGIAAKRR